jgi:hypothetical protein
MDALNYAITLLVTFSVPVEVDSNYSRMEKHALMKMNV